MLYPKNLPNWERVLRVVASLGMVAYALLGANPPLITGLLLFSALFVVVTGFVGFCPMCALFGRKLKSKNLQG
ncbi:MAG: DUF2892 domain-containing protein [Chloroflexota bacterium]